ncbi:MAG: alpha-galactosidase [Clostridiales bacterium]|nr:alpha-galactosidase [Clostridiales bacterium]
MITVKGDKTPLFILDTPHTTYAMKVTGSGHIEHLYYGRKIRLDDDDGLTEQHEFAPGTSAVYSKEQSNFSLDDIRLEMSSYGKGDVREAFLEIVNSDGSMTSDFLYESFSESRGRDGGTEGLPTSYGEDAEVLTVTLADKANALKLELIYCVYPDSDAITRNARLINEGEGDVKIRKLMSTQIDLDPDSYVFTTFTGAWAREMKKTDMSVSSARLVNSSYTGNSSNRANPFVMLSRRGATEEYGDVYGFNLVYSGNHYESVEKSPFGKVRFLSGINPTGFEWKLAKGESFLTPEAVMTYSSMGYNGMSGQMHDFVSKHILRGPWKDRLRPVLLNSWEASYFKISEGKLLRLARKAKQAGIELFVMDDGWFGERNDDTTSLGDWYPNKKKLPHGVKGICDKVRALGLEFGIWVEPEMVCRNSNLYREHPAWAMEIPGKDHSEGRNQMVLDLSSTEVQDYLIKAMSDVFSSADISYVKWDMNRNFSDVFSKSLPCDRQGEAAHRYILGLYRVMRELTKKFPEILFEGCASGGNRFDLGILSFFPQIWASDDTDALCRSEIQNGYSYGYPMSTVTAHVSDCPNHQTLRRTPIETRFNVASFGVLGYECNLNDMSKEDFEAVKAQISMYKKWREVMQFGRFFRSKSMNDSRSCDGDELGGSGISALEPLPGNEISWTVVSPDKSKAVSMTMQILTHPNAQWGVLKPLGLDECSKYHLEGREMKFDLRDFGGLINYVAPFHVKQDGFIHKTVAKFYKMNAEKESHDMYGDAMMYAGVHLRSAFASGGYNENMRYYPDFGSRIYTIEKVE